MVIVDNLSISVSRGDSLDLSVTFNGDVPPDRTTAVVSIKRLIDGPVVISKEYEVKDGSIDVSFTPQETDIAKGRYFWDIRLVYETGTVYTPFNPAEFNVLEVVGNVSV